MRLASLVFLGCLLLAAPAGATTVTLGAAKDTMIFQNNADNGAGGTPGFFAGTNAQPSIRRGLIAFDLAPIPATAAITDVKLRLVIGQIAGSGGGAGNGSLDPIIDLYKLKVGWTESDTGKSTADNLGGTGQGSAAHDLDATWNVRSFNAPTAMPWTTPGGAAGSDYESVASASLQQGNNMGDISIWNTAGMISDVQSWLASPSTNNGWMLINENETGTQNFRGFYSKEFDPTNPPADLATLYPQLIVTYSVPEPSSVVLLAIGVGILVIRRRK